MLSFKIARHENAKLILKYIHDLAVAEGFPFEITVTESDIETNLLGQNSHATALILQYDDQPCGFAVFYYTFSTTTGKPGLHLDDLYVEPEFQGKGIGKKTLVHLAKLAQQQDCARFEWWALKTNDSAIKFYLSMGAQPLEELSVFRLDQAQIERIATE
ncbi:GNAT family N-acetyltransferase [Marinomonas sp. THO17]|uniref:GNAT family N-acetyltransferase n=1 Tax=Marinomonas sp. THO17 TaxID=3149048 RepID=UPI00336C170F